MEIVKPESFMHRSLPLIDRRWAARWSPARRRSVGRPERRRMASLAGSAYQRMPHGWIGTAPGAVVKVHAQQRDQRRQLLDELDNGERSASGHRYDLGDTRRLAVPHRNGRQ
jgi:hypothetical protein